MGNKTGVYVDTSAFIAFIEDINLLTVISVGWDEIYAATSLIRKFSDQELTQTDAVGLHILEKCTLDCCWSTDFHLGLTGIPLVIHQY